MIVDIFDPRGTEIQTKRFDSENTCIVLNLTMDDVAEIVEQDYGRSGPVVFMPTKGITSRLREFVFRLIKHVYQNNVVIKVEQTTGDTFNPKDIPPSADRSKNL